SILLEDGIRGGIYSVGILPFVRVTHAPLADLVHHDVDPCAAWLIVASDDFVAVQRAGLCRFDVANLFFGTVERLDDSSDIPSDPAEYDAVPEGFRQVEVLPPERA